MPPTLQTQAIVLRTTKLAEYDRFLVCLTPTYGKLTVLARGVRKPASKLSGACGGLSELSVLLATGKSIPALQQFETRHPFSAIRSCYHAMTASMLLSEAVEKLTPHSSESADWAKHPEADDGPVGQLYQAFRAWLIKTDALILKSKRPDEPERHSAMRHHLAMGLAYLLTLSGHGLNVHVCVCCQTPLEDPSALSVWTLHWGSQGIVCKGCRGFFAASLIPISSSTLMLLQGVSFSAADSLDDSLLFDDDNQPWGQATQAQKAAEKALRFCLSWLLHTLPSKPKSLASVEQSLLSTTNKTESLNTGNPRADLAQSS
ncbi:MAG: recombination protein O N-terminal domain-containing protein [Vampirovibrionales bacterium]|nr:recombination protein O N-terminal domain-containing protein [Vampirovibrionales bacterium]